MSGGGNVLLHMATRQPERVRAMVLVSATSYSPEQARHIMSAIPQSRLWIIPNGGHGPVIGDKWPEFIRTALAFLQE